MHIVPVPPVGGSVDSLTLSHVDASLTAVPDPWERARRASQLIDALRHLSRAVFGVRRDAVRELVEEHRASKALVARELGVSHARVHQLLEDDRTIEDGAQ